MGLDAGLNLSAEELRQFSEYGKSKLSMPAKVAIIASGDLAFGLSRMYEVYREDTVAELMVFRTEQKARSWLIER